MPDTAIDPAAALAPPPGWNPQSSGQTPMDVNPMTMGGTPQLPPPQQPNVQDPSVIPSYAPSMAGATDPELAAGHAHQNWLGHIMDVVGSILGGDQTIHITKSPDGTMSVTHDPSTTAEKWGRVAQAALMGGAAGMQAGQGPGGMAKAIAAGVQTGAQQQPLQLAQANQQATAENTQLLASANNALLHQKMVQAGLESQQLGMTVGKEQADLLNGMADAASSSPNAHTLPSVGSMDEIMKLQASYADFFKTHTNNQMKVFVTPDAKGNVRFTPVIVDTAYNDRKNDHVEQAYSVDVDPQTHEPILKSTPIDIGTQPQGQIDAAKQANALKYIDARNKWLTASSTAEKKEAPTAPKSAQEALAMAALEKDPNLKQAYTDLAPQMQKFELAQKAAGRAPAAGAVPSLGGATGGNALASLNPGDAATVKAIGEGRQAPPSRFTKEGQRIMGMVNQVYPDYDSTQFPTYQKMRNYMTSGEGGVGLNFIGTARNHLNELESTIPDNVSVPLIGSAINWAKNTALRATSPQLRAFESARSAVSSEVAKAYKGGALSLAEHDQMMGLINESDSPDALRGSIGEFRKLLNGKLTSYQTQWNSAMPRGVVSPNSTLENLTTGTPTPTAQPAAGAAPPINLVPAGHDTTFANGQVWRNVNGTATRIK